MGPPPSNTPPTTAQGSSTIPSWFEKQKDAILPALQSQPSPPSPPPYPGYPMPQTARYVCTNAGCGKTYLRDRHRIHHEKCKHGAKICRIVCTIAGCKETFASHPIRIRHEKTVRKHCPKRIHACPQYRVAAGRLIGTTTFPPGMVSDSDQVKSVMYSKAQ
jgi:hypothetical protein